MNPEFGTFAYFADEYSRFRKLIGNRETFADPERPFLAYRGLLYVGINTNERSDLVTRTLQSALEELQRRLVLAPIALRRQDLREVFKSVEVEPTVPV